MAQGRTTAGLHAAGAMIALLLAPLLAGCAGRHFARPEPESLVLGQTTQEAVVERFGRPLATGTLTKHGVVVTTVSYSFAAVGTAATAGVFPGRTLSLYFLDRMLVGHEFISSFAADHTDFDDSTVRQIQVGMTTQAGVVGLLGTPAGVYRYPLVNGKDDEALVYAYRYVKPQPAALVRRFEVHEKRLVVTHDSRGVVTDVEFTTSSQRLGG